jgi:hypothetical protein
MEKSDKFRGEPAKGGEVCARNTNYSYEKRTTPLDFKEGFEKLKEGLTWRNCRLPSQTRINLSLCQLFCLSVRAKRGIWSKRVLIRKIGNLSFSVG